MNQKITGKIKVSDGTVCYTAELRGWWTIAQIAAAFADGYDTGDEGIAGTEIECDIRVDGESIGGFTMVDDGKGGVNKMGKYPHRVSWK